MANKTVMNRISYVPSSDRRSGDVNAIVETPKGSRVKFDYDEDLCLFRLGGMLPQGSVFPFNFGFIPSTLAEDGDPLDVLVLMEEPAFQGSLVPVRLIGVIEAEQTDEDGETLRNDRLIAIASHSRQHADVESLKTLAPDAIAEIEHFFVAYNEARGKRFKPLGRHGAKRARKLLKAAQRRRAAKEAGKPGSGAKRKARSKAERQAKSKVESKAKKAERQAKSKAKSRVKKQPASTATAG
jgi:inorganic pyrophosphatase